MSGDLRPVVRVGDGWREGEIREPKRRTRVNFSCLLDNAPSPIY